MIRPISIYYYTQIDPMAKPSYVVYELDNKEGKDFYMLTHTPTKGKNKGIEGITLSTRELSNNKKEYCLSNYSIKKLYPLAKSGHLTKLKGNAVYNNRIRYYGDLPFIKNPILVEHHISYKLKTATLKIMVFEGTIQDSLPLYKQWEQGKIKESITGNLRPLISD